MNHCVGSNPTGCNSSFATSFLDISAFYCISFSSYCMLDWYDSKNFDCDLNTCGIFQYSNYYIICRVFNFLLLEVEISNSYLDGDWSNSPWDRRISLRYNIIVIVIVLLKLEIPSISPIKYRVNWSYLYPNFTIWYFEYNFT